MKWMATEKTPQVLSMAAALREVAIESQVEDSEGLAGSDVLHTLLGAAQVVAPGVPFTAFRLPKRTSCVTVVHFARHTN